jgi:hypothetical protein
VSLANVPGQNVVPVNQPVLLQFNRFLNPTTITRQTVVLQDVGGGVFASPAVDYDPVLLQVSLSNPSPNDTWLIEGQTYEVSVQAQTPTNGGVQAVDNATLPNNAVIVFTAGPAVETPPEPTMHFCADVWPSFKGPLIPIGTFGSFTLGRCASGNCHGAPQPIPVSPRFPTGMSSPADGLVLDTPAYVALTAIGKTAIESNEGALATSSAPGSHFGIDMPIIDPGRNGEGDPGDSWLLYKVLLSAPLPEAYAGPNHLDVPVACGPFVTNTTFQANAPYDVDATERERLGNLMPGREMPYPACPGIPASQAGEMEPGCGETDVAYSLTVQQLERLRLWIKQGATFDEFTLPDGSKTTACTACVPLLDAGAPSDAGAMADAPADSSSGPTDAGTKG